MLFERAECFDQAASVYIQLKNWNKLGELLPKVTSSKIHLQYAKVRQSCALRKFMYGENALKAEIDTLK